MRTRDTKKSSMQLPARELPRKSGFGSAEIRMAMLEDIDRGLTPVDKDTASQLIYDGKSEKRYRQDF